MLIEKGGDGGRLWSISSWRSWRANGVSPGASLRQIVTCDKVPGKLSTGYPQLNVFSYILINQAMIQDN